MKIEDIFGFKVLNSRGEWTIKVFVSSEISLGSFVVPSGKSKSEKEVVYLPPEVCVEKIGKIKKDFIGMDDENQEEIDKKLMEIGGKRMERIGGNLGIGISVANMVCASYDNEMEIFDYIAKKYKSTPSFPTPLFNVINGGLHSGSNLSFQEFLIIPLEGSFLEKMETAVEFYRELKNFLIKEYGKFSINVGDEGGFVPNVKKNSEALDIIEKVSGRIGSEIRVGLDVAANSFFRNDKYLVDGKEMEEEEYLEYLLKIIEDYEIFYLEDPFPENKPELFKRIKESTKTIVVGDDLFSTNPEILRKNSESANGIIIKPNQVGTITKTIETIEIARKLDYKIVVSHRSGDSEDSFISDFSYGIGADFVKFGAPARGERTSKYNRLIEIFNLYG